MNDDCETENGNKETSIQPFKKSIKKTDIISYTCDVCSKEFEKKDRLTRHKFIHLETKPYSCEVCSKTFSRVDHLQKHSRTHFKDPLKPNDLRPPRTVHKCHICPKEFSRKDSFNKHLATHSGVKPFSCEICSKAFGRRDHLDKHIKTHSKRKSRECFPESIPECQQRMNGGDTDEQEMETDLVYECEVEIHDPIEPKHNGGDSLKTEQKPEKIHKCDVCSKTFARKDTLRKHSIIHSGGVKPFSCDICSKAFGRRDHMKKHLLTHPEDKLRTKINSDVIVKVKRK